VVHQISSSSITLKQDVPLGDVPISSVPLVSSPLVPTLPRGCWIRICVEYGRDSCWETDSERFQLISDRSPLAVSVVGKVPLDRMESHEKAAYLFKLVFNEAFGPFDGQEQGEGGADAIDQNGRVYLCSEQELKENRRCESNDFDER